MAINHSGSSVAVSTKTPQYVKLIEAINNQNSLFYSKTHKVLCAQCNTAVYWFEDSYDCTCGYPHTVYFVPK